MGEGKGADPTMHPTPPTPSWDHDYTLGSLGHKPAQHFTLPPLNTMAWGLLGWHACCPLLLLLCSWPYLLALASFTSCSCSAPGRALDGLGPTMVAFHHCLVTLPLIMLLAASFLSRCHGAWHLAHFWLSVWSTCMAKWLLTVSMASLLVGSSTKACGGGGWGHLHMHRQTCRHTNRQVPQLSPPLPL